MHKHVYTISLMGKIFGCPVYMDIHICMPQEEHTLLALTLNIKSTGMHGLLLMLEGNLGKKKKKKHPITIYLFCFWLGALFLFVVGYHASLVILHATINK